MHAVVNFSFYDDTLTFVFNFLSCLLWFQVFEVHDLFKGALCCFFFVCFVSDIIWLDCNDAWHDRLMIYYIAVQHFFFQFRIHDG